MLMPRLMFHYNRLVIVIISFFKNNIWVKLLLKDIIINNGLHMCSFMQCILSLISMLRTYDVILISRVIQMQSFESKWFLRRDGKGRMSSSCLMVVYVGGILHRHEPMYKQLIRERKFKRRSSTRDCQKNMVCCTQQSFGRYVW